MTDVALDAHASSRPSTLARAGHYLRDHLISLYMAFAILYLMLPVAVMALFSFNNPPGKSNVAWHEFSLDAWLNPFGVPGLADVVRTSVLIAFLATIVATALGTLIALAVISLVGAIGVGIAGCFIVSASLLPFVVAGGFLVVAYNLGPFEGRFHTDFWFAAAWGAFPALTSWWVNTLSFGSAKTVVAGALVTAGCFGLAAVQRRLSTPVRRLRRKTISVIGEQRLQDGPVIPLRAAELARPLDGALRGLSWAVVVLAIGLVVIQY